MEKSRTPMFQKKAITETNRFREHSHTPGVVNKRTDRFMENSHTPRVANKRKDRFMENNHTPMYPINEQTGSWKTVIHQNKQRKTTKA